MTLFGSSWSEVFDDWDKGMPHFTDCSGRCEDCLTHYKGGCLAGHGDDEFIQISEEEKFRYLNDTIRKK